jgi:hypothetical protein
MKKTNLIIVIVLVLSNVVGYSQTTNKDEMVKKVFATLKNKDEEAFIKLFPDGATMRNFFFATIATDTAGKKEEMAAFNSLMSDSNLEEDYREDFKKFIRKGEKNGVNWTEARFVSHTVDSMVAEEDGVKMRTLQGKIYFNVGEKEFYLRFSDVIWFDNKGWFGVNINKVDEKSKESMADNMPGFDGDEDVPTAEELEAGRIADSTRIADSLAVIGNKKPVQKQKAKQPVNPKPKTKTQTPAKKPE